MKKYTPLIIILTSYLAILILTHSEIVSYRVPPKLTEQYLHSQDIPHEVYARVFLSDSDIHIAAAKQYALGADPTKYNFQHPPFIKYLYGFAYLLWGNPLLIQVGFGLLLLCTVYSFGLRLSRNQIVPIAACLLLVIDPLFIDLSAYAMLDLGQTALLMTYLYFFLYDSKKWIMNGILLGVLAGSKFWGVPLFFVVLFSIYNYRAILKNWKPYLLHLLIGGLIFCALYIPTFIIREGKFNIIIFELKSLIYWLNHSTSSLPGASLLLFTTGYFKSWWGQNEIIRTLTWSIAWPISLIISLVASLDWFRKKKFKNHKLLFSFIPILYLIYLGVQIPFPRYFIVILPFLYLVSAKWIVEFPFVTKGIRRLIRKI